MSDSYFLPNSHESVWEHSSRLDKDYSFDSYKIEIDLAKRDAQKQKELQGTRAWIGLHPQTLMTPYSEIYEFINILKDYSVNSIIDFGAGYCRIPIVLNTLMPACRFTGYEIVLERVNEARRVLRLNDIDNWSLSQEDILSSNFYFPIGEVYFIYDFSNPKDMVRILDQIVKIAEKKDIFLVARGRGVRSLIQNKYPEFWACYDPIHRDNWSLYSNFIELAQES